MSHNSVESEIRRRPVPEKADWDSLYPIFAKYLWLMEWLAKKL